MGGPLIRFRESKQKVSGVGLLNISNYCAYCTVSY